jgi:FkbM family methyltransferase
MNLILDDSQLTQKFMMNIIDGGMEYEPEVCGFLRTILQPGDNFIDVGAHVGYFTILASELIGSGEVWSFEPEEDNYDGLVANIGENTCENIAPFRFCVGDENKDVELIVNLDNDGGHSIFDPSTHPFNARTRKNDTVKQTVPMVTLDSVIDFIPKAIKIDTEGSEFNVLKGSERIIREHSPSIIMEANAYSLKEAGTSLKEIVDYMKERGYVGYMLSTGEVLKDMNDDIPYVFNVVFVRVYESLYKKDIN